MRLRHRKFWRQYEEDNLVAARAGVRWYTGGNTPNISCYQCGTPITEGRGWIINPYGAYVNLVEDDRGSRHSSGVRGEPCPLILFRSDLTG